MDSDNIGARIAAIIKALNIKKVHFAEQLKIDQSYVTQLTNGRRTPSERLISTICREFNVNETWLRTGEGDMFLEMPDNAVEQLAKELGLDEFMQGIFSEYLKLNEEQRKVVRNFVQKMAQQTISESASPSLPLHSPEPPQSLAEELAELRRQNKELAEKVAALEKEAAAEAAYEDDSTETLEAAYRRSSGYVPRADASAWTITGEMEAVEDAGTA